jgi:hypothetical protein
MFIIFLTQENEMYDWEHEFTVIRGEGEGGNQPMWQGLIENLKR